MPRTKTPPKPSKAIPVIASDDPAETHRNYATAMTAPELASYRVITAVEQKAVVEQFDAVAVMKVLRDHSCAANAGDLRHAESMLINQASALQSLFVRLTERAMGQECMPNFEAFMRLALRAQNQCRMTLETLSTIKNPPVVYAKQINQTTGPQQINNGSAPSRKREIEKQQNELLEANDGERLDTRATSAAISADPIMATVGTLDGAEVGRG